MSQVEGAFGQTGRSRVALQELDVGEVALDDVEVNHQRGRVKAFG